MVERCATLLLVAWLALCAGCDDGPVSADDPHDADRPDAADMAVTDARVLLDEGQMGPCATVAALEAREGRWVFEGETLSNDHTGSCGGAEGDDRVLQFTAPEAGRWRFWVTADFDPMLSARADCVLRESERACNDDVGFPRRRDAAVQVDLAAGETLYLVVDAYVEFGLPAGGAFRLEAARVPVVRPDDACDPQRVDDGCATAHVCVPDHPGLLGGRGTCRQDVQPRVDAVWVHRDDPALALRVDGRDATGDVTEVRLQLYQGDERLVLGHNGENTWVLGTEVFGETRFSTVHHAPLLVGAGAADAVEVWLVDSQGNESARVREALERAPELAPDDVCDLDRVLDACPPGTACRDERCTQTARPEIDAATVFWNPSGPAFGIEVVGRDADRDLRGVVVVVFNAEGDPVGEAKRRFDAIEWTGNTFRAVLGFASNPDLQFTAAGLLIYDDEGQESAPAMAEVTGPVPVEAGAACDPAGARTRCPAELRCVGPGATTCGMPAVACPPDHPTATAEQRGDGTWRAAFDLWGAADRGAASCGGGVGQAFVRFVAPAVGLYEATATADDPAGDPVLSARRHCGYDAPWSELACNDDRARGDRAASVRVELAAEQTVWFVVDGYSGQDGWWAGPGALTVRRVD